MQTTNTSSISNDELALGDYLVIARARWPWILVPVVVTVALAGILGSRQAPRFESTAQVLLADTASQRTLDPSSQNTGVLTRQMSNEIALALSDEIETMVEDELGEVPSISVSAADEADVLIFTATADTAERAAVAANTWAELYVQAKQDQAVANIETTITGLQNHLAELRVERQEIRQPLDALDDRIARATDEDLEAQLQRDYDRLADDLSYELELVNAEASATLTSLTQLELQAELAAIGEARINQVAAPPTASSNPPLSRNLVLGAVVGLIIGAALALFRESQDTTISDLADLRRVTDLPVLSSVPASSRPSDALGRVTATDPRDPCSDAFQRLRSSIEFASVGRPLRSLLITSASPGEGKSTTASNLALALAEVGHRAVLVDLDLRRPTQHRIHDVPRAPGFTDLARDSGVLADLPPVLDQLGHGQMRVIPAGTPPPNPAAFVSTGPSISALHWLGEQADVTVIDSPPVLFASDAHSLASRADGVVLVVRAGETSRSSLADTIENLEIVDATVLGVVLVGVANADSYYYQDELAISASDVVDLTDPSAQHTSSNGSKPPRQVPARS